jgi:hypothetical protein
MTGIDAERRNQSKRFTGILQDPASRMEDYE